MRRVKIERTAFVAIFVGHDGDESSSRCGDAPPFLQRADKVYVVFEIVSRNDRVGGSRTKRQHRPVTGDIGLARPSGRVSCSAGNAAGCQVHADEPRSRLAGAAADLDDESFGGLSEHCGSFRMFVVGVLRESTVPTKDPARGNPNPSRQSPPNR